MRIPSFVPISVSVRLARCLALSLGLLGCGGPAEGEADESAVRTTSSAALTSGPIYDKWMAMGGPQSVLGNPSTDEVVASDGRGRFAHFQGLAGSRGNLPPGSIYWTPTTGAHPISSEMRDKWAEAGWERSALGYPNSDEFPWDQGKAQTFEGGFTYWDTVFVNRVRFFAQNMALLAAPAPYKGHDRAAAKQGLIDYLRLNRPHVVGLSEVFVDGERTEIKRAVADIYPFTMEGPDEGDLESDGGLLMLSQFPLLNTDKTIYRVCRGEDCLANKGVLKARLDLPGERDIDVYLTHLQSPNPAVGIPDEGPGDTGPEKLRNQLTVLGEFIAATRDRVIPALLMGDINVNGRDELDYSDMLRRLKQPQRPIDVWRELKRGDLTNPNGITNSDPMSSFKPNSTIRPANDPARFQSGNRLDYFIAYNGNLFRPILTNTSVQVVQTAAGRDISDHYGLVTTLESISRVEAGYTRDPLSVTTSLTNYHCLIETDGTFNAGYDEVEFRVRLTPQTGAAVTSGKSALQTHVSRGTNRNFNRPPGPITVSNPGSAVTLRVEGWEVDEGPFGIVTGRAHLGAADLFLSKSELFEAFWVPIQRKVRLRKAGGEYIVTVSISTK